MVRWEAFKIITGFAGTHVILQVLADSGMLGHAYRMLQERDCPSWLYPVVMGAMTIVSVHSPKIFPQVRMCLIVRHAVGALELDATGRHHQAGPDDFIRPLNPWLSMQLPAQHGRRPESGFARLEDRSGLPQAGRTDPPCSRVVQLPIWALLRQLEHQGLKDGHNCHCTS